MKIEIYNRLTATGTEYYEWDLWDGPDGKDHMHGYANDLVQAFSKIIEWRERLSRDYVDEFLTDMKTLKNFTKNNETDCEPTN